MIKEKEYTLRRKKLANSMDSFSLSIIVSAKMTTRSNDTEYPYRQNSNLYYLTGFKEDNSILVIIKKKKSFKSYMFVQKKDKTLELWTGKRSGEKLAKKLFNVSDVFTSDIFEEKIVELSKNIRALYYDFKIDDKRLGYIKSKTVNLAHYYNLASILGKQRLIKSKQEIKLIKKALSITAKAHHHAMKVSKELSYEYELQADIEHIFKRNGAYSDAYTSIVACSNNANTLHYIENSDKLKNGELILIDAGCEYDYYASDITRTIPVNGKFSDAQQELYEMVLDVEKQVIKMIKPGIYRSDLHKASERLLCEGMVKLGILKGSVKKLLKKSKHKKYYPHGIGHWMGLDVHDECPYKDENDKELKLVSGMVMTIEPGIYIDKDDMSVAKKYRGIGIRIEDDILVTRMGHDNLSKSIKKEIYEIEDQKID